MWSTTYYVTYYATLYNDIQYKHLSATFLSPNTNAEGIIKPKVKFLLKILGCLKCYTFQMYMYVYYLHRVVLAVYKENVRIVKYLIILHSLVSHLYIEYID